MGVAGKVLIVDDEPEALENCRRILSRLHYDCLTESDPCRALDVLQRERPGLVLTDLRMPGLDGIDVLNAAKRLDPDVQVVLLTAFATVQTAVTSMRQGAFDYLSKPFARAELERVVRRAFGHETSEGVAGTDHNVTSFKHAKQRMVRSFERGFLQELLKRNGGHMGKAAREAGVDRKTIERMVKRHGLRGTF